MTNNSINQLLDWQVNKELANLPLVSANDFRQGMRYFAAGVSIITSKNSELSAGLTATAVCSVTADPARLVVFINKDVLAATTILKTGALCINLLSAQQEEIAAAFAGMIPNITGADRFKYGTWHTLKTGAPALHDAAANFDCKVIKVYNESTHYAFLCEVVAIQENTNSQVLIYLNGKFYKLEL